MNEEYKCKDCKWLTGRKNIRGVECMNPVLQEKWNGQKNMWMGELRKDTARYKQRNAPACKKFEAKGNEETPSKDVVRCAECIWRDKDNQGEDYCTYVKGLADINGDSFCSWGERNDDEF